MTGLDPQEWIRPRRGLGALGERLRHGPARVAYLGASVTVQRDGFRPLLHAGLEREFGHAHHAVNAAVGAVGSVSAAFLMDALVLASPVDLCVIEYTTGDWGGKSRLGDVGPAVEGIVRKLAAHGTEACILHLWREGPRMSWDDPVVSAYERVADGYGVPSVHVGRLLEDERRVTGRSARDWFRDVVHTTPAGAARTAAAILDALRSLVAMPPVAHLDRPALHPNHFGDGRVVLAPDIWQGPPCDWQAFRLAYRYMELTEHQALIFESSRALKGLFIVVGPRAARLRISSASRSIVCEQRDEWTDYERISTVVFDDSLPPSAPIRIEHDGSGDVKIIGFLVTGQQAGRDRVRLVQR